MEAAKMVRAIRSIIKNDYFSASAKTQIEASEAKIGNINKTALWLWVLIITFFSI